jgi:hypothetical protein
VPGIAGILLSSISFLSCSRAFEGSAPSAGSPAGQAGPEMIVATLHPRVSSLLQPDLDALARVVAEVILKGLAEAACRVPGRPRRPGATQERTGSTTS